MEHETDAETLTAKFVGIAKKKRDFGMYTSCNKLLSLGRYFCLGFLSPSNFYDDILVDEERVK
jgi:hypothetical protein